MFLEHYLKDENKPYLISWDKSRQDMPIYDLVSLYKNNYLDFEFTSLLKIYLSKYPLTKDLKKKKNPQKQKKKLNQMVAFSTLLKIY